MTLHVRSFFLDYDGDFQKTLVKSSALQIELETPLQRITKSTNHTDRNQLVLFIDNMFKEVNLTGTKNAMINGLPKKVQ